MSMAGCWFLLMVNEAFKLGDRDFQLPGVGSYMSAAAANGDVWAMTAAVLAMIALIVFLDQLLWRPLVIWSQKFRIEETGPPLIAETWFLNILRNSSLIGGIHRLGRNLSRSIQNLCAKKRNPPSKEIFPLAVSRFFLILVFALLLTAAFFVARLLMGMQLEQWIYLSSMVLLTFLRVAACLSISLLIALPLGLTLGLSEKALGYLEPLIQIGASFPATLLFPAAILLLHFLGVSLAIGSVVLMLMGSFWYVFLNVIAGAKAIPSDLKEVAANFQLNRIQRFFWLQLPAIFPYLVVGIMTAAGGAWNASIVAEYVNYKGEVLTTPGIGSSISLAAQNNDMPLLAASILALAVFVVLLNYSFWLRLYRYSEQHFAINN